ncbi:cbb3-type cytochrome c oxidase subunit II, partial [Neisseria sp. P0006.S006]
MKLQQLAEEKVGVLIVFTLLVVSVGLLIEAVPLFFTKAVTEPAPGVKPYNALQVA